MLRVARRLGQENPVGISTTFLGAHALPPEFAGRADDYVDRVCEEMLPAIARENLADAVDAFCEHIAFTPAQVERVFLASKALGLPVKLHAEQLSNLRGAALAARHGALSADHLEYLDENDAAVLARSGTVAVLLPGAFYCLRETKLPPLDALRRLGVPVALATDCNPGSSPVTSLTLILNMACTLFRMTPAEALTGITRHGARALGLQADVGTLEVGKRADIVLWNATEPAELAYRIGDDLCDRVLYGGRGIDKAARP
jgi:imidazolonepropionase